MNPKRRFSFHVAGHTVALVVGALCAFAAYRSPAATSSMGAGEGHGKKEVKAATFAEGVSKSHPREVRAVTSAASKEAYRQAWAQLLDRKIPKKEKIDLQYRLLAEWAEVDLDAALAAAALEPGEGYRFSSFGCFDAFLAKMDKDPEQFWLAIRENRFGLVTAKLRNVWIERLGTSHPEILLSHLHELSSGACQRAFNASVMAFGKDPELKNRFVASIAALPDNNDNRDVWRMMGGSFAEEDAAALVSQLADASSEGERRMLLSGLTLKLGNSENVDEVRNGFGKIPDALKKDAALALLGMNSNTESVFVAGDHLLATNDWDVVQKNLAIKIDSFAMDPFASGILEWGGKLPERTETEDLYRCTVRGYIRNEPEKARDWIMEMPSGWKRDNALTEYIHSMIIVNKDDQAAWALGQIESPHFQQTVENMRAKWNGQRINSKPGH